MSGEREPDGGAPPEGAAGDPAAPTSFERSVGEALGAALSAMRAEGVVEVEAENVDALVLEIQREAVEASSLNKLLKRVVAALVDSERVEEVYGTDRELEAFLRRFFERAG